MTTTTLTPMTLPTLAAMPSALRALLGGLPEAVANEAHDAGGWSVRDCVAHLLDRAPMQRRRVEAMLAEQHPTLMNEDETASLAASGFRLPAPAARGAPRPVRGAAGGRCAAVPRSDGR